MTNPKNTAPAESAANSLLTKEQIALHLQIGPRTVDDWMKRRIIPFLKIGKAVRFRLSDVLETLARYRIN
jgi:excisionase family DNA binding protein